MRDKFWLQEIVDNCRLANEFANQDTVAATYALQKVTEIVWEATKALSEETRVQLFPDQSEMRQLRNTRNFYAHQYHRVDPDVARAIAKNELRRLGHRAERLLEERAGETA